MLFSNKLISIFSETFMHYLKKIVDRIGTVRRFNIMQHPRSNDCIQKCSVHVEIIAKSHPEVQRSFGSRSAASMSKLFQSQKKKIGGIPII
jgi:hypothetical protein